MSNSQGRSGTRARLAAQAAASALDSECDAVSIKARPAPQRRAASSAASRRATGTAPTNGERPLSGTRCCRALLVLDSDSAAL